jgi:hypothetical protein
VGPVGLEPTTYGIQVEAERRSALLVISALRLGRLGLLSRIERPRTRVLHADRIRRDSMALDLIEPLRPVIDTAVLDLIAARSFHKIDFIAVRDGTCRLTETITHPLAEQLLAWGATVGPIADAVAHSLTANATGSLIERTPLTQRHRHSAIDGLWRRVRG